MKDRLKLLRPKKSYDFQLFEKEVNKIEELPSTSKFI